MRITDLDLSKLSSDAIEGLQPQTLSRLGGTVYLAGANGSGKTRLLRALKRAVGPAKPVAEALRKQITARKDQLGALEEAGLGDQEHARRLKQQISDTSNQLAMSQAARIDPPAGAVRFVEFVPREHRLTDPITYNSQQLLSSAKQAEQPGMAKMAGSAIALIEYLQRRAWDASHPQSEASAEDKTRAEQEYAAVCRSVESLLGVRPERNRDSLVTLFGRTIGQAKLSEGQAALLQFAVALHAQGASLGELIILLDEPETHLHPEALVQVVAALQLANARGQLWIATHSVHLLANARPEEIWFVEKGLAEHAGKTPERVLHGLLGGAEAIEQLQRFCGLPAQLALDRFAAECLVPPASVMTGAEDPQSRQIWALLRARSGDDPIRVVDWGAGKGRLLNALEPAQAQRMDYYAFERATEDAPSCQQALRRCYVDAERRFFDTDSWKLDDHSVDIVIMCNVLHEIDPSDWCALLSERLPRSLKPDGFLLVVEDYELAVGEQAHRAGFLLLDEPELRALFGWKESGPSIVTQSERNGRLKAHLVPAELLRRMTSATREACLRMLAERAMEQIKVLRKPPATYANGRLHALWCQLHVNASLALKAC